jgi:hypothetical protein
MPGQRSSGSRRNPIEGGPACLVTTKYSWTTMTGRSMGRLRGDMAWCRRRGSSTRRSTEKRGAPWHRGRASPWRQAVEVWFGDEIAPDRVSAFSSEAQRFADNCDSVGDKLGCWEKGGQWGRDADDVRSQQHLGAQEKAGTRRGRPGRCNLGAQRGWS